MLKSRFKSISAFAAVAIFAVGLVGCGETDASGGDIEEYTGTVPIFTPRQGGSAYVLGGGLGNQLSEQVEGIQGSAQATTGTQEIVQRLTESQDMGQPAFSVNDSAGAARAVNGEPPFEEPFPDLRTLSYAQESVVYIVTNADSDIDEIADLEGASLGLGVEGSPVNFLTKEVLEAHGLTDDAYEELPLGYQEVADGLADGNLDAGVIAGAAPVSTLTELATSHDVKIVNVDQDIMADLSDQAPYVFPVETEGGVYNNIEDPAHTFGFSVSVLTHKDTPDALVTSMMEILYENTEELAAVHPSANDITAENATKGVAVEFHPAAASYLEELGVELP